VDPDGLWDELARVAARLGVEVRVEPFETPPAGAGGLCVVAGRRLVLLDARAARDRRIDALARALAGLGVDDVYMAPEARERIEAAAGRPAPPPPEGQARPGPGPPAGAGSDAPAGPVTS
jgi:hypothetical protein